MSYIFYFVLLFVAIVESIYPKYNLENVGHRWLVNGLLFVLWLIISWGSKFFVVDLIGEYDSVNQLSDVSIWLFIFQFLLIDLFQYVLHRLSHSYRLLWAAHLVHHSDKELDVSTQFRHHPIEILISFVLFITFAFLCSIESIVVFYYGLCASAIAMWHHSNFLDKHPIFSYIGLVVVTPSIHHIHHSSLREQTDSNYGTVFVVWDKIAGTYKEPKLEKVKQYGLSYFQRPDSLTVVEVLKQPFTYLAANTRHKKHSSVTKNESASRGQANINE